MKRFFFRIFLFLVLSVLLFYFFPEKNLPKNVKIDSIVVSKSKKKLYAYSNNKLIKTYKITIGRNEVGRKEYEGDNKTPEGNYIINDKNSQSGYHKNLGVSYPNEEDKLYAKKLCKPTGGDIKIHGLRNGLGFIGRFHLFASTRGCIRVTNAEMDELYNSVEIGTKIVINP